MHETHNEDYALQRARKRVEDIKGFYVHLGIYLIVNTALFAINMVTTPDTLWFYWPLLGWGIGVAIHAFALVTEGRLFGPEWEQRKLEQLLQRERGRSQPH
jgi:uncharacterized membrane protein